MLVRAGDYCLRVKYQQLRSFIYDCADLIRNALMLEVMNISR